MKKTLCIIVLALLTAMVGSADDKIRTHFVKPVLTNQVLVMSDIHTMAPALVTKNGSAFDNYANNDMRMIAQSGEILDAIVKCAEKQLPWAVLITGDLTKDGERLSHEYVISKLQRLRKLGIKVLVIPGNHDISNPNAKSFNGKKTSAATTINREEFASLYADFGYGADSERDPNSLSYSTVLQPNVMLIAIDSNRDEENLLKSRGDSIDRYHNAGRIKPETIEWIAAQAAQARADGMQVIAMMHHHAVQHFDKEQTLLSNYIVDNATQVREQLMDAGIHLILTGHLHVNDIALDYNREKTDSIYEIATGSAITYPFAYRLLTPSMKWDEVDVTTEYITSVPSCPNLKETGRGKLAHAAESMTAMAANRLWSKLDGKLGKVAGVLAMMEAPIKLPESAEEIQQIALRYFKEPMQQTVMEFVEADESTRDNTHIAEAFKEQFKVALNDMLHGEGGRVTEFLIEELFPKLEPMLKSVIEDRNNCGTSREVVVRDLNTTLFLH